MLHIRCVIASMVPVSVHRSCYHIVVTTQETLTLSVTSARFPSLHQLSTDVQAGHDGYACGGI